MRSVQTPASNAVYQLRGGTEANDLHVRKGQTAGPDGLVEAGDPCYHLPYVLSVWVPDDIERAAIGAGANLELVILGGGTPPLMLNATSEQPIDREARPDLDAPSIWLRIHATLANDVVDVIAALERQAEAAGEPIAEGLESSIGRLAQLRHYLESGLEQLADQRDEQADA